MCPHHPNDKCDCRKPNEKFLRQIERDYNIDLKNSYVIGDHDSDVELALNVGAKSILVLTGHGKKHYNNMVLKPNFIANNLLEAANKIIKNK